MNTQISINVNGDPRQILECAYHVLVSMGKPSYMYKITNYIDPNLLVARACIDRKYATRDTFACRIIVRQIDNLKCELVLTVDTFLSGAGKGTSVLFMSDFLQAFSQNYYPMTGLEQ